MIKNLKSLCTTEMKARAILIEALEVEAHIIIPMKTPTSDLMSIILEVTPLCLLTLILGRYQNES